MTQFGTGQATVQTGSREVGNASPFHGGLLPSERFPKEESERFHIRGTRSYVERAKETCFRNTETGGAPAS